jgi:hypothetical protein
MRASESKMVFARPVADEQFGRGTLSRALARQNWLRGAAGNCFLSTEVLL